jgi:hypothetical protein
MYIINSIGPRSLGKGNRFCASSSKDIPVDHTSDRIVYSWPQIRSGYRMKIRRRAQVTIERKLTDSHIETRACECAGEGVNQLARYAKIAQLDNPLTRNQYIGRFNISMDSLLRMQICEALQDLLRTSFTSGKTQSWETHSLRQPSRNFFPNNGSPILDTLANCFQTPAFTIVHKYLHFTR